MTGQLPGPRSDLSSVTVGSTAYLVGGYDGASYDGAVLATGNGSTFRTVATLPVPVRYAAVADTGNDIWVFGGLTPAGPTRDIQRVNLATGRAAIAGHLPAPVSGATAVTLAGRVFVIGGLSASGAASRAVLAFDPAHRSVTAAGTLPVPDSNAAAAVIGGTAFVVGGYDGHRQLPTVTQLRLVPATAALPAPGTALPGPGGAAGDPPSAGQILTSAPWLSPPHGKGHLAPHSNPSVLPGDILIADDWNNRLLIVDPQGRVRWRFPRPGDLARGQNFQLPDDAFFSPDGRYVIATEEEDSVVSVISIAKHKIVYRYGTPGVPGSSSNHVSNPDDAMMMPGGGLITSDIKNCRILLLAPPARQQYRPRRIIGTTGVCGHNPPHTFGSPNGAFPTTNGSYLVTEINSDWVTQMKLNGRVAWSTHPPGGGLPVRHQRDLPGPLPDGRLLTAGAGGRVRLQRAPAVAVRRAQPPLAGAARCRTATSSSTTTTTTGSSSSTRSPTGSSGSTGTPASRAPGRVPQRSRRRRPDAARLDADHPRGHHGRAVTTSRTSGRWARSARPAAAAKSG